MTIKTHPSALRNLKERVNKSFREGLKPPTGDEETRIDRENEATMKRIAQC